MTPKLNSYDSVLYPGDANEHTHPDRLAVMGLLHGMTPAPVGRCRVLEVGCSDGANLIPMAANMPDAHFTGFDLAQSPIDSAMSRIKSLGLKNVRVLQADLLNLPDDLGKFDYIIAHGVYAWVPPFVQDGLLALCRKHLAPQGIAFISYNCLPGSYVKQWTREIMLLAPDGNSFSDKLSIGLELVQAVINAREPGDPYRQLLEKQLKTLRERELAATFHDELEEAFTPVSFSSFIHHAALHDLQYVNESHYPAPTDPLFKPDVAGVAESIAKGDRVQAEQFLDLVRLRMYRETLLCHKEVRIDASPVVEVIGMLRFTSRATATPNDTPESKTYTLPGGIAMESRHPDTVALMDLIISRTPEALPYNELSSHLLDRGTVVDQAFLSQLLRLLIARFIDVHVWQPPVSHQVGAYPRTSVCARQEFAARGRATSLWHQPVTFADPFLRRCLLLADGTRNHAQLEDALSREFPDVEDVGNTTTAALAVLNRAGVLQVQERHSDPGTSAAGQPSI